MQHLTAVGTLNMSAMDMDVRSVSIMASSARRGCISAEDWRTAGAGMQIAYNLEKRDGAWVVKNSQSVDGMIQHTDPNKNPHQNQDVLPAVCRISRHCESRRCAPPGCAGPGSSARHAPQPKFTSSGTDQTPVKNPVEPGVITTLLRDLVVYLD